MDKRAIGVFDSGSGGLTAVRQLRLQLPNEDIIYFGDTGRVPYGTKSKETLIKYARQDIRFLLEFDIKAILIACNTADTVRMAFAQEYELPILGVVDPSARAAARTTGNGRIGLIGTPATIRSGAYESIIHAENPSAQVQAVACPLFVPLVENGRTQPGDPVIETVVEEYLLPLREWGCDTLVLGCTHYPLLSEVIGQFMGEQVKLINSGAEAARALALLLGQQGLLSDTKCRGSCRYYVSDSAEDFSALASRFLAEDVVGTVEQVDIGKY